MLNFPEILYEDNHLLIVNKRSGDIVQGDKTGDRPLSELMKLYLKEKYNKPGNVFLGVVHRLDRPATGIVIFARTDKALTRLNNLFKERNIHKTYWAVVKDLPAKTTDTLIHFLKKNEKLNKSFIFPANDSGASRAELKYTVIGHSTNYHLLEVELITGRHHQIRVQLASIGCPIKGDLKYKAQRSNQDGSIHLHARKVEFIHPVTQEQLSIIAPTPEDAVWNSFQ